MTTAEILNRAADLIEPEGAWTRDVYAREGNGTIANPLSKRACKFCALGAILHVMHLDLPYVGVDPFGEPVIATPIRALEEHLGEWPPFWQDTAGRTQAEVVAALRDAAKAAS